MPALAHQHTMPGTAYFIAQQEYHTVSALPHVDQFLKRKPHFDVGDEKPTVSMVLKSNVKAGFSEFINCEEEKATPDTPATEEEKEAIMRDLFDALNNLAENYKRMAPESVPVKRARNPPPSERCSVLSDAVVGAIEDMFCTISTRMTHQDLGGSNQQDVNADLLAFEQIAWTIVNERSLLTEATRIKFAASVGIANVDIYNYKGMGLRFNVFYGGQNETNIHSHVSNFMSFLVQGRYLATYYTVPNRLQQELAAICTQRQVEVGVLALTLGARRSAQTTIIESTFDKYDTNNDGLLDRREICSALTNLGFDLTDSVPACPGPRAVPLYR